MKFKYFVIGICLVIVSWLLGFPSYGATWLDPSLKWKTVETLHFSIHYYEGFEGTARRLAPIAEETHALLSGILKHTPDYKTDVVLLDTYDFTNGYSTVFPNPTVTLYLTDGGSNLKPSYYDEWLRYVFLHEYTHILHLDTVEGGPRFFKTLFGRIMFPNAIEPWFIIEGLATYMETKYGKGGRGHDPRWEAMLRMDVLEDNMKTIEQASVTTLRWPEGSLKYLYGVMFLQYLSDKYGEDKLTRLSQEYGDYFLSYGIDGCFRDIFGKPLWVLWNDWEAEIKDKYQREKTFIESEPVTAPRLLAKKGYYVLKPKWSPDSRSIFYNQSNPDEYGQIRRYNLAEGRDEKVTEGIIFDDALSASGDKLYFIKADIYHNYYLYKDLYVYDLKLKREKRLTAGARLSDPAVSPDGRQMAYVINGYGVRSLYVADIDLKSAKKIGDPAAQYFSPAFSPDGKKLAAAKFLPERTKINILDLSSGSERPLLPDSKSNESNPSFTPDGQYVIFDSDFTGVVNLYAYHLNDRRLFRVTNVLGAALMPEVSPDGRHIAYVNYSSRGHDLAVIDLNIKTWREVELGRPVSFEALRESSPEGVILSEHDYNPLPGFTPKFWVPLYFSDENGEHLLAYTAGIDALGWHYFAFQGGYDWAAKRPSYSLLYSNNQFLPQLSLVLSDFAAPYSWDGGSRTYWEREQNVGGYATFYDNRVISDHDQQSVTLGYEVTHLGNISSLETLATRPSLGSLRGAVLSYRYYSLRGTGYAVSPEDGLDVSAYLYLYSKNLGSDFELTRYIVYAQQCWPTLVRHHVLALSASGVLSRGDMIKQSSFSWRYFNVRGYPSDLIAGSKGITGSLEYRFPLSYTEAGMSYGYLFLNKIWGDLFYDYGGATFGPAADILWKRSLGAEMNFETMNLWSLFPLNIKIGYAQGLDAGGEEKFYVNIML